MEQEQEATETSNMTSPQQQQNETGGNETNQTGGEGGNETQQGPLEQLGDTLSDIFGGGNQSK